MKSGPQQRPRRRVKPGPWRTLSEREAVFSRTDVLAAALSWEPGAVSIGEAERTVGEFQKSGVLHAANLPVRGESLTTDRAIADEKETISLMSERSRPGPGPDARAGSGQACCARDRSRTDRKRR